MNYERMDRLADLLINKVSEDNFDMSTWAGKYKIEYYEDTGIKEFIKETFIESSLIKPFDCGTSCCIAGWAVAMKNNFKIVGHEYNGEYWESVKELAKEYLDLKEEQATMLFFPDNGDIWDDIAKEYNLVWDDTDDKYQNLTPDIAGKVIKRIIAGEFECWNYYNDYILVKGL
jgi:hypothetical protein